MANINKKALSELSGVSVSDIESVFQQISVAIANGDEIAIPQFGKFVSVLQKGKSGTVPGTTKTYTTSDKMTPKFRPSTKLKQLLTSGS